MPRFNATTGRNTPAIKSLNRVLDQSEHVKDVVEECAEELSSVNSELKEQLRSNPGTVSGVEGTLQKSQTIQSKVHECADELTTVNQALEEEVRERERLEHQLVVVSDQEEAARHAAFHDPLTSLPNRVLFNDRLEHGLAQARRHGWTLAVMFIDLDDFNSVNESYGHLAGDMVLKMIADRLKNTTREDDTVSRHGGDEFLYLVLEIKSEEDAILVAKKIVRTVSDPCEVRVNNVAIAPSIAPSVGIAIFPRDGDSADALVKCADKAMYRAKRNRTGYSFVR